MAACRLPRCRIRYCDRYPYSRSIFRTPTTSFSPYLPPLPTVFVGIVASVIWLIWNDPCIPSTRRGKMESVETDSASHFPSGEVLLCHSPRAKDFSDPILRLCMFIYIFLSITRSFVRINYTLRLSPTASALVQRMLHYFFTTLWPAFRHLGQATNTSLGGVSGGTAPRPQLVLPLFVPPEFREPYVATPHPIMPRDTSSFRVQSNPYSGSEPSSWPVASPYSVPVLPGSAPS